MKREITIAGGGLAGLSLAIALRRRDVPVRVFEASRYPRHRVCGEFISGVSPVTLETLGITNVFIDATAPSSVSWHDRNRLIHRGHLPRPAIGISRHLLDQRLHDVARSLGASVITGHRVAVESTCEREGHVWATGRKLRRGRWIGLKAHYRDLPRSADLEMHLGTNGYAGLAPVEGGWTNVCGMFYTDRSLVAKRHDLLPAYLAAGGNHALAKLLRGARLREGSFTSVAGFEPGRQFSPAHLFCIGDSESMIPPFTGNGMSMAFEAAETAVQPLLAWSDGESSWPDATRLVREALRQRFHLRMRAASFLHPLLFSKSGRLLIRSLAAARLFPFRPLYSLTR